MEGTSKSTIASYLFDDVVVDCATLRVQKGRVQKGGSPRKITPRAFEVLVYLLEHRGRIIEKQELFDKVWKERFVTDNALTRIIKEIRQVIGDHADAPRYIETIPKRGYRFIAEVTNVEEETPTPAAHTVSSSARLANLITAHRRTVIITLTALLIATAGSAYLFYSARSSAAITPSPSCRLLMATMIQIRNIFRTASPRASSATFHNCRSCASWRAPRSSASRAKRLTRKKSGDNSASKPC